MAMHSPLAVVMSASAMPPASGAGLPTPCTEMTLKVLIIPDTVPRSPSSGVRLAMVDRMFTCFSRIAASLPPLSSIASLTSHIPRPELLSPARNILAMDEESPWHRKIASEIFCFLSMSSICRINSEGITRFRLSSHNLSINTARAMMEQRMMG